MTTEGSQPVGAVVVGIDGTPNDEAPLRAAISQARVHRRPLHVLHATGIGIVPWTPERLATQHTLTGACVDEVAALAPDLAVSSSTEVADQSAALVEASRRAWLVVMGAGRLGRVGSVVLGATTGKVASHARCPVLVVPDAWTPTDRTDVVVGVDDSEHSVPAVEWAFAEASARRAGLVALHAWWWEEPSPLFDPPTDDEAGWTEDWSAVVESRRVMMSELLAGWREKYPDVEVRVELVRGDPTAVLEEASREAQLVVLGTRGRGGFTGLLLGSVSSRALHHSQCPVVVVPSLPLSR